MKSCKNCKHRLGEKGDESELKFGKDGLKVFSNCAQFRNMANVMFDPYYLRDTAVVGTRIAFHEDFCCCYFEEREYSEKEGDVPVPVGKVQYVPVDFSEPRPSQYEIPIEEPKALAEVLTPKPDEPVAESEKTACEPPESPSFDDYDEDDIPF